MANLHTSIFFVCNFPFFMFRLNTREAIDEHWTMYCTAVIFILLPKIIMLEARVYKIGTNKVYIQKLL